MLHPRVPRSTIANPPKGPFVVMNKLMRWMLAEMLTNSVWRLNLRAASEVELTWRGQRRPATARLVESLDEAATVYRALIAAPDPRKAGRGMDIRINVDRVTTREQLAEAARREGLSLVYLTPVRVAA